MAPEWPVGGAAHWMGPRGVQPGSLTAHKRVWQPAFACLSCSSPAGARPFLTRAHHHPGAGWAAPLRLWPWRTPRWRPSSKHQATESPWCERGSLGQNATLSDFLHSAVKVGDDDDSCKDDVPVHFYAPDGLWWTPYCPLIGAADAYAAATGERGLARAPP